MRSDRRSFARGLGIVGGLLLAPAPTQASGDGARAAKGQFLGPATCDSTHCHGAARPADGRVRQDEFATWFARDDHRRAWEALSAPLGRAMGERLGIDATKAAECLVCHAGSESAGANVADFGVSCEACHGAASGWYGTHFQRGFDRATAVRELGLNDTLDPVALAATCVRCHVGDATHVVDHRLIAAGHPDLAFEAGSFLLSMSPHWRQRGATSRDWFTRAALAGPLVALEAQLEKLAREAAGSLDFSSRECSSCHHDLADGGWDQLREWRLAHGLSVPIGRPLLDASRFVTAGAVASAVDATRGAALRETLHHMEQLANAQPFDGAAFTGAVELAGQQVQPLFDLLQARTEAESLAREVVTALSREGDRLAGHGMKAAEQAAQLIHSLQTTFDEASWNVAPGGAAAAIRARLLAPLTRPAEFRPADFAREWKATTERE